MAYTINKTDGTILATVADGQIDQLSSSITLIGKNYSGFGESINENFIKILENFSNTTAPANPIRGQIWFDTTELKLKVYNGLGFVPVSSATISNIQPVNLGVGDLWFDDANKQLYFYDGVNTILLGPDYSASQGLSGLRVANVLDSLNQNRVITYLYTNGILLGIFSKDTFTPKATIEGFTGDIQPGFNAGNLEGLKFNVTSTNAERLGNQPATSYVRNDTSNIIQGQIIISSNLGLIFGDANQGQFQVQDGNLILANIASDKDMSLIVKKGVLPETAIKLVAENRKVEIYKGFIGSTTEVGGDLVVEGNLNVKGTTTTINTSEVTIEDKNIVLAKQTGITPTDANASGGGVILQGTSSHIFLWSDLGQLATSNSPEAIEEGYNDSLPALASQAWNSSDHINLATGKEFKINGNTVINATSLGTGIVSIPGVKEFGKQIIIRVGPGEANELAQTELILENNRISTAKTNLDLELDPSGTGRISLIGSPNIIGLADPRSGVDGEQDAATREYVDRTVETRSIFLSMDISDGITNAAIAAILAQVVPVAEYRENTIARILCSFAIITTSSLDINPLVALPNTDEFRKADGGTAFAVTNVAFSLATISSPGITISRTIKTFEIINNAWTFVNETFA